MIFVWLSIAIWMMAVVIVELTVNTEKVNPIDITDPEGEDKWGAM